MYLAKVLASPLLRSTGLPAFIVFILVLACKEEPKKAIATEAVTFSKEGELSIFRGSTDSLLTKLDIEIADTEYETQTGLMYRKSMADNRAMLFVFPDVAMHSFYMKNTEFSIDIIFIDEDLKVASFTDRAKPFDETGISSVVPIQYVLEINAGLREKWQLQVGDSIVYNRGTIP